MLGIRHVDMAGFGKERTLTQPISTGCLKAGEQGPRLEEAERAEELGRNCHATEPIPSQVGTVDHPGGLQEKQGQAKYLVVLQLACPR